ncbi:hypothetical protein QQ020_34535 [Fulvivirgaceae bacterium BMA12]|uniref:Transglutaminase-like domain-containing protein n=1 Tax=Agaribacillus aureus TaxID=3051825 RepID=A0ABT8LHG8_9BACT|nr:hypothetical protein [Fulvivirgaceae bacterium BMA12]
MKKLLLPLFAFCNYATTVIGQNPADSLIRYADLRFHSEFENKALNNFYKNRKDTFNLFLAIDPEMTENLASRHYTTYKQVFKALNEKNINAKKINKKIKSSYSITHSHFLKKYNENEYFPVMFESGNYNCVSASMIYAMVFDELEIPYVVKASARHVYLVANPGANSVVIETTNPGFEKAIFNGEFKQQYVNYLRSSKLINESEYKNKSTEEIFEEKFNAVKDAEFSNLPGFQYYNKALTKLQNNEIGEALSLAQKAYFFFPDEQVKTLLYTALLYKIQKSKFEDEAEIDYLAQFSRFENTEQEAVIGIFNNIIAGFLEYTNKEGHCNALYQRFTAQLSDQSLIREIDFTYNLQMSYRFQKTNKIEPYITKALEIKGNHQDANIMMENHFNRKLLNINNTDVLLETINKLEQQYDIEAVKIHLKDHRSIAYLKIAAEKFEQRKSTAGEQYLQKFESTCDMPVDNQMLSFVVENTYRNVALYYKYRGYKTKAKAYIDRGMKFVPNSNILKTVIP